MADHHAKSTKKPKAGCFVDSLYRDKRRYCFWIEELGEVIDCKPLSIADMKTAMPKGLPGWPDYQVVIANFDAVNGGKEYNSNDTLDYFRTNGWKDAKGFVNAGGRFVCEIQAASGLPVERAYEAIFGRNELAVGHYGFDPRDSCFDTAWLDFHNNDHPAFPGPSVVFTGLQDLRKPQEWFPELAGGSETEFVKYPEMISWGWFTDWGDGWIPLLWTPRKCKDGKYHPVMLAKQGQKGGEFIATTMLLANSGIRELAIRLLFSDQIVLNSFYVKACRRVRKKFLFFNLQASIVFAGILIAIYKWLPSVIIGASVGICFTLGRLSYLSWKSQFSLGYASSWSLLLEVFNLKKRGQ